VTQLPDGAAVVITTADMYRELVILTRTVDHWRRSSTRGCARSTTTKPAYVAWSGVSGPAWASPAY